MTQFLKVDAVTRQVMSASGFRDSEDIAEATSSAPDAEDGFEWRAWQGRINFSGGPTPMHVFAWPVDATAPVWIDLRTIEEARADKVTEMRACCAAAITGGFTSAALGVEHQYPAKLTDQTNLAGSIIDSLIPGPADWTTPFWCGDSAGDWKFRMHTATQIQQVGRDAKAAILAAMTRNEALRVRIEGATREELDAIGWLP